MGIPTAGDGGGGPANPVVNALPFRGYLEIWNEYFRDENLQDAIDVETALQSQLTTLRTRAWEKDYFTSALPFAQRGPAVNLPLGEDAPIISNPDNPLQGQFTQNTDGSPSDPDSSLRKDNVGNIYDALTGKTQHINPNNSWVADLANATATTINELRKASALQRWLERQARGGYRYIETILSHFGIRSSDARLQRPEYLGGNKQPITISEVICLGRMDFRLYFV